MSADVLKKKNVNIHTYHMSIYEKYSVGHGKNNVLMHENVLIVYM